MIVYADGWSRGANFSKIPVMVKAALLAFKNWTYLDWTRHLTYASNETLDYLAAYQDYVNSVAAAEAANAPKICNTTVMNDDADNGTNGSNVINAITSLIFFNCTVNSTNVSTVTPLPEPIPPPLPDIPRFEVEIIDTMCEGKNGINQICNTQLDVTSDMEAIYQGHRLFCGRFPAPRVAIGGTNNPTRIETYAKMAASYGIPTVGFGTWAGDWSVTNTTEFPNYTRIIPDSAYIFRNIVRILKHDMGFDNATMWVCDEMYGNAMFAMAAYEAQQIGLVLQQVRVTPISQMLPGVKALLNRDYPPHVNDPLGIAWYKYADLAKEFGSYANILAMSAECPVYEFMSFLGYLDLVGPGRFWTSSYSVQELAVGYAPVFERYSSVYSPYASSMPFDHIHNLDFGMPLESDSNLTQWWDSVDEGFVEGWLKEFWGDENYTAKPQLGSHVEELFQPWPPEVGAASLSPSGGPVRETYLFDAVIAAQMGIVMALDAHGPEFTNENIGEMLRYVDFVGLTGKVALDAAGARIQTLYLSEYVQTCAYNASADDS